MLALYQVARVGSHVVTQVVETKLIVGTESDVCHICLAALIGIRTMLVDTIY